jgi:hypothetical protein
MRVFSIEPIHFSNESPKGVKGVTLAVGRPFPVYLDQQTFLVFVGTSQSANSGPRSQWSTSFIGPGDNRIETS